MRNTSVKTNALLNVLRQLCNTVLPLVTFAYATRVLGVENYGRINFCSSVVSYFLLLAGLGVSAYAVREASGIRNNPMEIQRFASQVFSINMAATLAAYLMFGLTLLIWNPGEKYLSLLLIYSLSILLTTLSADWVFNVYEDFLYITLRSILVHVLQIVLVFLLVKEPEDAALYSLIMVGSVGMLQIVNFFLARKRVPFRLTREWRLAEHLQPILLLFANSILVIIYMSSDITMLGIIRGDSEVGLYKAAVNIYQAVKTLLNAIYIASIPRLAFYRRNEREAEFSSLANGIVNVLATFLFPALTGLFLVSKNVILLFSGENYLAASVPLRVLAVSLLFASAGGFFVNGILIVCKKEKQVLRITILSALANALLNLVFIPLWGMVGAAWTTLIAEAIVAVFSFVYANRLVRIRLEGKAVFAILLGCAGIVLIYLAVSALHLEGLIGTFLIVVFGAVVYGLVQLLLRPAFVKSFLKRKK